MAVTVPEARELVLEFCRTYPVAAQLAYYIRDTVEELYGARGVGMTMRGGYITGPGLHPGRCDIPSGMAKDVDDFIATLRHEVIGHFGLNTFTGSEKKALLDGLCGSRQERSMRGMWVLVDAMYGGMPESGKAEEIFALFCEGVEPVRHINYEPINERGEQAFRETCIDRTRAMRIDDLDSITLMVAQGLHDRTRTQQNFPELNQQFRKNINMETKKPFHEQVAEKLIEQLQQGTAPWQRPWQPGEPSAFMPKNPTTGKRYKGINAIHLLAQGHADQRWLTYKQATAVDAQVRKGEKGTAIQYWKFTEEQNKTDASGKPILDKNGEAVKQIVTLERPRMFVATVFNAEQIDGMPPIQQKEQKEQSWSAVERAELILKSSGATLQHSDSDRAFYRSLSDSIHLPNKSQFLTADAYYATALHELGHWTGHESRLNRDLANPFGSEGYAKEELRAEIASMILGDELGIGHDPSQHVAYVASWIKTLQDDPMEVFRAAADAEKIQSYVLGLEQVQVQEQTTQQSQEKNMQAEELGFTLPGVWNGKVLVQGDIQMKSLEFVPATSLGKDPELYSVYIQLEDETYERLAYFPTQQQADELAEKLALIDANAEINEYEKAAKLAYIEEQRLRRDPNSTDGEILAAKEIRKSAEMAATLDDEDLKNKIEEFDSVYRTSTEAVDDKNNANEKIWLDIPFAQKEEAKALGAKWDRQEKSWYIPSGVDAEPFSKWQEAAVTQPDNTQNPEQVTPSKKVTEQRQYLAVPFEDRVAAKEAGAAWDKAAKSWYVELNADMSKLERWKPDNVVNQQGPAMTPQEEFAEALRSLGCVVSGEHPIMDGTKQRISVEGEKHTENAGSGFYVGHLDGHPAGFIKNNKTGIDMKWKSKGYSLDPEQKAQLMAEAATKLQAREAEQVKLHEQSSQRVVRQVVGLISVEQPTPYMLAKGIEPQLGVLTDKDGKTTYIPATDVDGKQWTMQYIKEDGTKRFAKDSRKEGCFHVVGGMDALAKAPAIVIGEGYATASSLSHALGFATVSAFDSGNLPLVAKALHEKFPDKPVIIAGDNDLHLEETQGVNPGKTKAQEAAKITGGKMVLPIFAPGEQVSKPKEFTDFNDLATKSTLGKVGIDRQIRSIVDAEIQKHQEKIKQQDQVQKQEQRPRRAKKLG